MTLQFIHDKNGNTTGVYIPIDEWQDLKAKYTDLQAEETQNNIALAPWQKEIIDQRLADLNNPEKFKSIEHLFDVLDEEA